MAKLLKITTEVYLPGATAADWSLTYPPNSPYLVAGKLAGGVTGGALEPVPDKAGWWRWPQTQTVFGGELGDGEPPLVTVRITPTLPAGKKVLPINYQGHPREITPPVNGTGGGTWDLSRIGAGGPVLASEAQLINLATGLTDLDTKKARADADHAAVTQSLADSAQTQQIVLDTVNTRQYATSAEREADAAPNGTWSITVDSNDIHRRESGVWALKGNRNNLQASYQFTATAVAARVAAAASPPFAINSDRIKFGSVALHNPLTDIAYTNAPAAIQVSFRRGECPSPAYLRVLDSTGAVVPFQWEPCLDANALVDISLHPDGSLRDGILWIQASVGAGGTNTYTVELSESTNTAPAAVVTYTVIDATKEQFSSQGRDFIFQSTSAWTLRAIRESSGTVNVSADVSNGVGFVLGVSRKTDNTDVNNNNSANVTAVSHGQIGTANYGYGAIYREWETVFTWAHDPSVKTTLRFRVWADGSVSITSRFDTTGTSTSRAAMLYVYPATISGNTETRDNELVYAASDGATRQWLVGWRYSQTITEIADPAGYSLTRTMSVPNAMQVGWSQQSARSTPAGAIFTQHAFASFNWGAGNRLSELLRRRNPLGSRVAWNTIQEIRQDVVSILAPTVRMARAYGLPDTWAALRAIGQVGSSLAAGYGYDPQPDLNIALTTFYSGGTTTGFYNAWFNNSRGFQYQGRDAAAPPIIRAEALRRGNQILALQMETLIHAWADMVVLAEANTRSRFLVDGANPGLPGTPVDDPGRLDLSPASGANLNAASTGMVILAQSLKLQSNATRLACYQRLQAWYAQGIEDRNHLPRQRHQDSTAYIKGAYNSVLAEVAHYHLYSLYDLLHANELIPFTAFGVTLPDPAQYIYQMFNASGQMLERQYTHDLARRGTPQNHFYAAALLIQYGKSVSDYSQAMRLLEHVHARRLPAGGYQHPIDGWGMTDPVANMIAISSAQVTTELLLALVN